MLLKMSETILIFIVSFCGAVLSALGMGGGGILLMYLTAYAKTDQLAAQGINLVFFIPVAIVALIIHIKNGLVRWKIALPCIVIGLAGVWGGAWLANMIGSQLLRKFFGGFLLIIGLRELFSKKQTKKIEN